MASNTSHMILSRKMLKRAGESRHPCQTPTVVLNQAAVLLLNRAVLWALYRFSMAHMMLALMLCFLIVTRKASCLTLKSFLWCCRCFAQRILRLNMCSVVLLPALKPACSNAVISSACGWSLFREIFNMTLLGCLIRLTVL